MEIRDLRPAAGQSFEAADWCVRLSLAENGTELVATYTDPAGGRLAVTVSDLTTLFEHEDGYELLRVMVRSEESRLTVSVDGVGAPHLDPTLTQGRLFVRQLLAGQLRLVRVTSGRQGISRRRDDCLTRSQHLGG